MKSNFDNEIKSILEKMHEVELQSIPEKEELQKRYMLSELFHKRLSKLVNKVEREEKVRNAARYVAATAAVLLLFCCVTQPGIIANAYKEIVKAFEDHISIKFKDNVSITEIPEYEVGYVPEGYVLVGNNSGMCETSLTFRNQKDFLYINYAYADGSFGFDNEERMYKFIVLEDGTEIHYFESKVDRKGSTMAWLSKDGTLVFSISGPFSEEELLKIQKNIHKK